MKRIIDINEAELWISSISVRVQELISSFPKNKRKKLDYTTESLTFIEEFLINRYPSLTNALNNDPDIRFINNAGTYVGEVFRKYYGGEWFIDTDKSDSVLYGVPVIRNHKGLHSTVQYPTMWTTAAIDRRNGHFILDRLIYQQLK